MARLREIWDELRQSSSTTATATFRMKLFTNGPSLRLYGALDTLTAQPAILLELPAYLELKAITQLTSRAFDAKAGCFDGLPPECSGIALILKDVSYQDLFELLSAEVTKVVQTASTATLAVHGLVGVIDRWRRFVEKDRSVLSESRVRGLIGELIVLLRLQSKFGHRTALPAWTGPLDTLRDFQLPDFSLEVKTYQSDSGQSVRISHIEQLDDVQARPVFLVALQLAQSDTNGFPLSQIVQTVRTNLDLDMEMLELFDVRLAEYGYMQSHANHYTSKYLIERLCAFHVSNDFPRIRPADVPAAVHDVQYSLDLPSLASFKVDADQILGMPQKPHENSP